MLVNTTLISDSFQFLERLRNKYKLLQMDLPSIAGFGSFLNTPLEESENKQLLFDGFLPEWLDDRCTKGDVSALFKIGIVGPASLPFVNMTGPPEPSHTEDGYHYCWDLSLRQILRALISEGEGICNTNYHTETRNARPDFGYPITKRCVFGGEEKGPTSSGDQSWAVFPLGHGSFDGYVATVNGFARFKLSVMFDYPWPRRTCFQFRTTAHISLFINLQSNLQRLYIQLG